MSNDDTKPKFEDSSKFFDTQKFGGLVRNRQRGISNYVTRNGMGGHAFDPNNIYYADGSDALANDGLTISFRHVPSDKNVYFKAFITAFNESYNSDWNEEPVFGRADPIYTFKQTTRKISLTFVVPAATVSEGFENMGRTQKLLSFLYPNYTDVDNALSISQSPLIRLKVMNLAQTTKDIPVDGGFNFDNTVTTQQELIQKRDENTSGLLGAITNVSVNHNLDNPDTGAFHTSTGTVIPKLIEISVEFSVMHETHLGWDSEDNFSDPLFPYGADTTGARTKDDIRTARGADQAAIVREAEGIFQELEDERFLQAQQDIAKAMFLNPDGKTLNSFGKTMQRRLDETNRSPDDRRLFTTGIKNPAKARYMAQALASIERDSEGNYANSAADVRQSGDTAEQNATDLGAESWSWIK